MKLSNRIYQLSQSDCETFYSCFLIQKGFMSLREDQLRSAILRIWLIFYYIYQPMILWTILIVFLLLIAFLFHKYYLAVKKELARYSAILSSLGYRVCNIPIKPMRIPVLTRFKQGVSQYSDALYYQKNEYKNFDFVLTNFLSSTGICIVNSEFTKLFVSAGMQQNYQKVSMAAMIQILGQGIVFAEGDQWKNKRKTLSKAFKHELILENIPKMKEIINRTFDKFESRCATGSQTYKYNIMDVSNHILAGFMTQCFFGVQQIKDKIDDTQFPIFACKILADANMLSISPAVLLLKQHAYTWGINHSLRDLKRRVSILRSIAEQIIQKRRDDLEKSQSTASCTDIIQALIREKGISGQDYVYTNKDIIEEFCTFLMAGTDTTSHFITMMVYYVTANPSIEEKVRKQISEVIKSDKDITVQNLKKLTYIDWIQNQTNRFYGPGTNLLLRKAVKDHILGDIPIKAGTLMTSLVLSANYKEEYFDKPYQFRPQRWENKTESLSYNIISFGFGGGPRSCIGKHLALLNSKIFLVKLLLRYKQINNPKKHPIMRMNFLYEPIPFQTELIK